MINAHIETTTHTDSITMKGIYSSLIDAKQARVAPTMFMQIYKGWSFEI